MRSATAWLLIAAMTVVSLLFLALVATFRFAIPLIDPAPLPPDYGMQAAVAFVTMGAALVGGIGAGLHASRHAQERAVIVGWAGVALLIGTVLGTVLAFTLSAR